MANAFIFHPNPPLTEKPFVLNSNLPFMYYNIPTDKVTYPYSKDSNTETLLRDLTSKLSNKVWMLAMPEFDQGGGAWKNAGRPNPDPLSRVNTYNSALSGVAMNGGKGSSTSARWL
jgi:hypothetical protein